LAGLEFTASTEIAGNRVAVTAGVFGLNDTAGTLLAFRGWALHDEKATAFSKQPLPQLNETMEFIQAPATRPIIELDNRPGYYVKLVWAPPGPFELQALHYDNRGDPKAVNPQLQWGWRTTFDHLGAILDLGERTRLVAQAISGTTRMGYKENGVIWVDTDFRSAFLLATRQIGKSSVSARIEAFGTRDHGSFMGRSENEDGWAVTAAARHPITSYATMLFEIVHIESRRAAREREGLSPRQDQNLAQLALRLRI
jgi:hypothetical protein